MVAERKPSALVTRNVEGDGYARTRSHGNGKKGQRPWREADAADVRLAIAELEAAHEMLTSDVSTMARWEQRDNHREALAKIALAGRFLDDVIIRRDAPFASGRAAARAKSTRSAH